MAHQMGRWFVKGVVFSAVLATLSVGSNAAAQTGKGKAAAPRTRSLAVVPLDRASGTSSITSNIQRTLQGSQFRLQDVSQLKSKLYRHHEPDDPKKAAQLAKSMPNIAAGIRSYFYQSYKHSITKLTPILNLGLKHKTVLARRPSQAVQVYEAGVVLLRAFLDTKNQQNANATADLLAVHFPTHRPSSASAPPAIVKYVERRKELLKKTHKTTLELQLVDVSTDCQVFVNGLLHKDPSVAFPVDPSVLYLVHVNCGGQSPVLWRVKPVAGKANVVPITERDPFSYTMKNGAFSTRNTAEDYLRAIMFWTEVNTIVGVTRQGAQNAKDSVLFVRIDEGKGSEWSDGANRETIKRLLVRVLPELRGEALGPDAQKTLMGTDARATAVAPAPASGGSKVLPWVGVGASVLSMGVGSVLLWQAEGEADRLRCSPSSDVSDKGGCDGVDGAYGELTRAEFTDRTDAVSNRRVIGGSLIALGGVAGVLTAVFWPRSDAKAGAKGQTPQVQIAPGRDGLRVGVGLTF